jgi:hypothetical protein
VHRAFVLIMAIAIAVRAAAAVAYWPALVDLDSWSYLASAHGDVWNTRVRPVGYPIALWLLSLAGRHVALVAVVQHLAGLATGVLVYTILRSRSASPRLAALAAGLVLLDAYSIALEQFVLSETLFTLAIVVCAWLSLTRRRRPLGLTLGGLALAVAVATRSVGVFAIAPWSSYALCCGAPPRVKLAGLAGLVVPIAVYGALHAAAGLGFGITQTPGWFLYGRVGEIANCRKARVPSETRQLCLPAGSPRHPGATWYIWAPESPVQRVFPGGPQHTTDVARSNRALTAFALAVVRDQPADYLRLVAADLVRFFTPGLMARGDREYIPVTFPADALTQRSMFADPGPHPRELPARVAPPAHELRLYARWVHPPRPLLAVAPLTGLIALLVAALRGAGRIPRWREVLLLTGVGSGLLVGSAATSEFAPRLLIPTIPLLVTGATIAAADLAAPHGRVRLSTSEPNSARSDPGPRRSSPTVLPCGCTATMEQDASA